MPLSTRVVIVQPYVPDYRVRFFERLAAEMRQRNITIQVVAPIANRGSQRGDETAGHEWHVPSISRSLRLGSATFTYYGSHDARRRADAVIVPAAGSCLDTHLALHSRGSRTGLWGHIASYVKQQNSVDRLIERSLLGRADHVFAYVPSGARQAIADGVPPERVTAVMNTIDTTDIREHELRLSDDEIEEFGSRHHLTGRPTLAFIGSLDNSKRVPFLASALDELWRVDPTVRLVVLGRGDQEHLLAAARARQQVVTLGRVGARTKALVSKFAHAIANPGRIGLVAVDALTLQLPIITAEGARHAPEYEYLTEGTTLFTTRDDPRDYAMKLASTRLPISPLGDVPSLQSMCENFAEGIVRLLSKS